MLLGVGSVIGAATGVACPNCHDACNKSFVLRFANIRDVNLIGM